MSGCGPGTRATCSAVLSGAFEAHPPLGTAPGYRGGGWWRVTAYAQDIGRRFLGSPKLDWVAICLPSKSGFFAQATGSAWLVAGAGVPAAQLRTS
jgi:hypothetical protein